jgi:hypothetical protein
MPVQSNPSRSRAIVGAATVMIAAVVIVIIVIIAITGGDSDPSAAPAAIGSAADPAITAAPAPAPTAVPGTTVMVDPTAAVTTSALPAIPAIPATPATSPPTQVAPTEPLPVEVAPSSGVLFSTSFDVAGTALDNGMVLPSFGPHLTPRPGVVANGAIFRDPAMTEWEDVLVRAPVGPLSGDRYIEAVVTVAANGGDAHPAIMFFDDPPTTSGGCAGGSTMDWAEVDPWNNMQAGRISFVVDGCYDATSHVFAGVIGSYRTYTVRAEIVTTLDGAEIVMKLDGAEIARTTIPAGLDLPFAGLRLGQFGEEGGYDEYRIESFEVGLL